MSTAACPGECSAMHRISTVRIVINVLLDTVMVIKASDFLSLRGYSLSSTTGAVLSGAVTPGGNSMIRILRKWISAPSDSKQM